MTTATATNETYIYDIVDNIVDAVLTLSNSEDQFRYLFDSLMEYRAEEVDADVCEGIARDRDEFIILGKALNVWPLDEDEIEVAMDLATRR